MRSIIFTVLCMLLVFFSLPGCTSPEDQHVKNGDYYFEQEDWTLAISEYEKALAIDPEIDVKSRLLKAHSNRALKYIDKYQCKYAIEDIEMLRSLDPEIELPPVLAEAYLGDVELMITVGKWEEAKEHSAAALEIDPDSIDANNNLALILLLQGFHDRAITYANKVIQLDSENKIAYMIRSEALINLDDLDSAMLDAEKLIMLYPDSKEGYYFRGWINWLQNNYQEIVPDMDIVLVMDSNDANAYHVRGVAYSWFGEWYKAEEDFNRAIEIFPDFREALLNRAVVYSNTRRCDLAIADADKVIRLNMFPNTTDVMCDKARLIISYCIHE